MKRHNSSEMQVHPVQLPPIHNSQYFAQRVDNPEEFNRLDSTYQPEHLNEGQREIFDYVQANPNHIVFVQGRTGTGKTFLLRTIGHLRCERKASTDVIIYKHDLLDQFKYIANRKTVAKIFMDIFDLSFDEYRSLKNDICSETNGVEFIAALASLLDNAEMPNFGGSLVILDEYTCVPEPLLFLLLVLLKHYKIGTIVCGDPNQMPMSPSSPLIKSFDIASHMADETFNLEVNMRCNDAEYNSLVDFVSEFCSERRLDRFGYAIVAAMFPKQLLCDHVKFSAIHQGYENQVVTYQVDKLVREQNIPVSFYCVDNKEPQCVKNYKIDGPNRLGKFLPYLPLSVGTIYYIDEHSEASQATLVNVDLENEVLTLRSKDGKEYQVKKSNDDNAMFSNHKKYILNGHCGSVYNYPIYPTNMMSLHKSQGFNINLPIDLNLDYGITYQALYVALSRVNSPKQIARISIPSSISHLVSTIINFPEHDFKFKIPAKSLAIRMEEGNYVYYDINDESLLPLCVNFFDDATPPNVRQVLRQDILKLAKASASASYFSKKMILKPPMKSNQISTEASQALVSHWPKYLALSQIDKDDRRAWIREFVQCSTDMACFKKQYMASPVKIKSENIHSQFMRDVHAKQSSQDDIEMDWLVGKLNEMCERKYNVGSVGA